MTPTQALLYWREHQPAAVAVRMRDRSYTWALFAGHVARAAAALERAGLGRDQVLGVQCRDTYLNLVLVLAAEAIGATHVTLVPTELGATDRIAPHCSILVTEVATAPLRPQQVVIRLDDAWVGRELAPRASRAEFERLAVALPPGLGVRLGRTSGTTGAAKLMLNRRSLIDASLALYEQLYPPVGPHYTFHCGYPLTVRGVYLDAMHAIRRGCRIAIASPQTLVSIRDPERCWTWLLAGAAERLARTCNDRGRFLGLHFMKFVGSKLTRPLRERLCQGLTEHVFEIYSSNEANTVAILPPEGPGRIAPGIEVMICDQQMRPLPQGETGLIAVRGPRVIEGYLGDPALTRQQFRDGWFVMNDFGRMAGEGLLEVLGRADDMLDLGGVKVAPYGAEAALRALPGVSDAVLLQARNDLGIGEIRIAIETTSPPPADAIRAAIGPQLSQNLAAHPVHVASAFPRTETGKVIRAELARQVAGHDGMS